MPFLERPASLCTHKDINHAGSRCVADMKNLLYAAGMLLLFGIKINIKRGSGTSLVIPFALCNLVESIPLLWSFQMLCFIFCILEGSRITVYVGVKCI